MRYVLLDRVVLLDPPKLARGIKCVSLSDDVFADHFPGYPVMPGALMLEAMAQIGGVLVEGTIRQRGRDDLHALLTMVDKGRFRKVVRPGDRLEVEATGITVTEDGGRVRAVCKLEGELASEAELTYAFTRITQPKLLERRREVLNTWLYGTSDPEPGATPAGGT